MMNRRGLVVVLLAWLAILAAVTHCRAADLAVRRHHSRFCQSVRGYVGLYGAGPVEAFARSRGATERDIARGRRCLR